MQFLTITILILALAGLGAGQDQPAKSSDAPAAEHSQKAARLRPDLKVQIVDGKFEFSRETPFGTSRWLRTESELLSIERAVLVQRGFIEGSDEAPVAAAPESSGARPDVEVVVVDGKYEFSRETPFGTSRWTKAEKELSEQERAILERRGLLKPAEAPVQP